MHAMRKMVMAGMFGFAATLVWASGSGAMAFDLLGSRHKVPAAQEAPVILAQSTDAEMRVQQLEEQVRQLTGKVEDMTFQLLQMQEQLRKTQEDNEFRFQELEGGKKKSSLETVPGAETQTTDTASGEISPEAVPDPALEQPMDSAANDPALGKPLGDLGSIQFDTNGNVVGAETPNPDAIPTTDLPPPDTSTTKDTASLDTTSEGSQYQVAYEQILAGDYASAEQGFAGFISSHPDSKKAADANFWLGEAQYSQGKYNESAKTFLNAYKTYGKSNKGPEMLLKLAMSLAALDSKDTACATLREVSKAYPKASRAIINKVASEQKRLAC
jgi:tol-pal system protein YbgF